MAEPEKQHSTELRNTITVGVTATPNSTFEGREVGAHVTPGLPHEAARQLPGPPDNFLDGLVHHWRTAPLGRTE
jgi:hypothetical protein